MASFGTMPGNNAPPPVFGGTNPTGLVPGGFSTKNSFGFPQFPMFGGTPSNGIVTPTANLGIFGPNTNGSGGGGIQGLNSGFGGTSGDPNAPDELQRQLRNDYGNGMGSILSQILSGGLFNQQVADAFLNANQPAYNRGISSIETAFGAEGSRFGSAAALGIGDFSSQFNLNEQQTLATMYMNAQQEQLSLLENILPTVHAEQADSQAGVWKTIADIFAFGSLGPGFAQVAQNAGGAGGVNAGGANIGISDANSTMGSKSGGGAGVPSASSLESMLLGSSAGATQGGATGDISSLLMMGVGGM